jgi:hypothetical protein
MKQKCKYWYLHTIVYCPVCGKEDRYKERIYGIPKPENGEERYRIIEAYDWCDVL